MAQALQLAREGKTPDIADPRATEDALAAVAFVRANAKRWGVDPSRVGMMGFSAGAITSINAALAATAAARPAFIAPIYPPMRPLTVAADAPPMFTAIAIDVELFGEQGFGLVESWHHAKRPVELHAYEKGGHGFGLGRPGTTTQLMLDEFIAWLESRGIAPPRKL
jgi:acetyl esterase/lipase